jgi:hypothetical protein
MTATSLHLKGAGGTNTEIIHNVGTGPKCHDREALMAVTLAAGKTIIVSDFYFKGSNVCTDNNDPLRIIYVRGGGHTGLRITGNQFTHTYKNYAVYSVDAYGVIDTNIFHNGKPYQDGPGPSAWAAPTNPSGADFLFVEDNIFTRTIYGNSIDTNKGGRYVFRKNIVTYGYPESHAYRTTGWGTEYGTRAWQIYGNDFRTGPHSQQWLFYVLGGTGMAFDNTWTQTEGGSYTNPSKGMAIYLRAACDAARRCPAYPCPGQIGRGENQTLEPAYAWNNTLTGTLVHLTPYGCANSVAWQTENRDYYNHSTATGSPQTVGVRVGTKANMPASCTAGVAYWVTDEGDWNRKNDTPTATADGTLYKCTALNTWMSYFTPYPYPHPIRGATATRE